MCWTHCTNERFNFHIRLLISNLEGNYNFTITSAMGVITEGKNGQELSAALKRLESKRGVKTIRADVSNLIEHAKIIILSIDILLLQNNYCFL